MKFDSETRKVEAKRAYWSMRVPRKVPGRQSVRGGRRNRIPTTFMWVFSQKLELTLHPPLFSSCGKTHSLAKIDSLEVAISGRATGKYSDKNTTVQMTCSECPKKTQWYCKGCTLNDGIMRPVAVCGRDHKSDRGCWAKHMRKVVQLGHWIFFWISLLVKTF